MRRRALGLAIRAFYIALILAVVYYAYAERSRWITYPGQPIVQRSFVLGPLGEKSFVLEVGRQIEVAGVHFEVVKAVFRVEARASDYVTLVVLKDGGELQRITARDFDVGLERGPGNYTLLFRNQKARPTTVGIRVYVKLFKRPK